MPEHAIPEPFLWDESFAVFYAQLDDEHKGIFNGIFTCCEANNAANLDALKKTVTDHFVCEEAEYAKVITFSCNLLVLYMIRH